MNWDNVKDGGIIHRLSIARADIRYYGKKKHRYVALARVLWLVIVLRHYSETCQECGRRYSWSGWHAPAPLWAEVQGRYSGTMCPMCFGKKARALGYSIIWTPMVVGNFVDGKYVANSNHWSNETRDWLMMGQPDPNFMDHSESEVWRDVRDGLDSWGWELPDLSYYPPENFKVSRSIPEAGAHETDRRARALLK